MSDIGDSPGIGEGPDLSPVVKRSELSGMSGRGVTSLLPGPGPMPDLSPDGGFMRVRAKCPTKGKGRACRLVPTLARLSVVTGMLGMAGKSPVSGMSDLPRLSRVCASAPKVGVVDNSLPRPVCLECLARCVCWGCPSLFLGFVGRA